MNESDLNDIFEAILNLRVRRCIFISRTLHSEFFLSIRIWSPEDKESSEMNYWFMLYYLHNGNLIATFRGKQFHISGSDKDILFEIYELLNNRKPNT